MKKISLLVPAVICLICFSSCNAILLTLGGYKHIRFETTAYLDKKANELHIDKTRRLYCKDSTATERLVALSNLNPGILIFQNSAHPGIYNPENLACPAPVEVYLKNTCNSNPAKLDEKLDEKEFEALLVNEKNEPYRIADYKNGNHIYIFWAVWLNKKLRYRQQWEHIADSLACNHQVYWINTDYQGKFFGVSKRKKIKMTSRIKRE